MYYGYGLGYHFDWTIILVLVGALISGLASLNVNATFNKYNKVRNLVLYKKEGYRND